MSKTKRNKIKQKKTFKKRIIQKGGEDEICSICRDTLNVPGDIYVHTCLNKFHSKCLKQWCNDKEDECPCPICRQPITEDFFECEHFKLNFQYYKLQHEIVIKKHNELVGRFNNLREKCLRDREKYLRDRTTFESRIKARDERLSAYDEAVDNFLETKIDKPK